MTAEGQVFDRGSRYHRFGVVASRGLREATMPPAKSDTPEPPKTTAEGHLIPAAVTAPPADFVPTAKDYAREYGTFRARTALFVGNARAFNAGDPVNASHPMLQPGEWGEGWIAEDLVERIQD